MELFSHLPHAVATVLPRLALDLACGGFLIHGVYLRLYPRREYALTYWMLNLITFAVAFTLAGVHV